MKIFMSVVLICGMLAFCVYSGVSLYQSIKSRKKEKEFKEVKEVKEDENKKV